MMNYEMFRGVVENEFKNYLGEGFKDTKIEVVPQFRVNEKKDAIVIIEKDGSNYMGMSPVIYVDDLFRMYNSSGDLKKTLNFAADLMKAGFDRKDSILSMTENVDKFMDIVVLQLINTNQNKELLADVPHKDFCDLSVIYRMVLSESDDHVYSAIVTNKMVEALKLNPDELFRKAVENTKRINPVVISSMNDVMGMMFSEQEVPDEITNFLVNDVPPENMMYIMTNKRGINGAVSMIFQDELHKLAEKLGDDLYILPSSLHEVIVITASGKDPR